MPELGDSVQVPGYTISVTEMDGRRIARLRVIPGKSADEQRENPPEEAAVNAGEGAANAGEGSANAGVGPVSADSKSST
jgi:putative hemolysin